MLLILEVQKVDMGLKDQRLCSAASRLGVVAGQRETSQRLCKHR